MPVRDIVHGPTLTVIGTTAIVAGTTSGYEEYEAFGPIQIIADAVIDHANCVMLPGGGDAADATSYPAGFVLRKFFTTFKLTSGQVEMVGIRDKASLGLS